MLQLTFYHDTQKCPFSKAIISRTISRKSAAAINIQIHTFRRLWNLCIFAYSFCHLQKRILSKYTLFSQQVLSTQRCKSKQMTRTQQQVLFDFSYVFRDIFNMVGSYINCNTQSAQAKLLFFVYHLFDAHIYVYGGMCRSYKANICV